MEAALYLNHPYGRPMIGWRHEIEKLTRDDALEFYRRFYTPNNAILIVAGDVTAEEVKKLAEETYGKVPRVAEVKPRVRPQEPAQEAPRTVTLADPRVTQPSLQRYYLVPSYTTGRPARPRRSTCSRTSWAAARTAGSIRSWWSRTASRSAPAPAITAPRSTRPASASTARRSPAPA